MIKKLHPLHSSVLVPNDYDFLNVIDRIADSSASKTAYRLYDEAMLKWLKKRFTIDGKSIPIIPAPPQNTFASYKTLLTELGYQSKCPENELDYSAYPLPMVNMNRVSEEIRDTGANIGYPIRNAALIKDGVKAVYTRYPKPMYFDYTVGLWALERKHIEWMKHSMEMSFWNHLAHTRVSLPFEIFKTKQIFAIKKQSGENITEYDRDDRKELIHRFVFRLRVEAWMWDDLIEAPTVLALNQPIHEEGGELLSDKVKTEFTPIRRITGKKAMPD